MIFTRRYALVLLTLFGCAPPSKPAPAMPDTSASLRESPQTIADQELARAMIESQPKAGLIVILDPSTGRILAMSGREGNKDTPRLAATHTYITGSTLKPLLAGAALDADVIHADTKIDCANRSYGQEQLTDPTPHGVMSLTEALAVSSSVASSRVYDRLGLPRFTTVLHQLHIGDPPAHFPVVTDPAGIQAATLAAGELAEATPLQVIGAYTAIFGDGTFVTPNEGGEPHRERVFRSETAATVRAMLEVAVNDGTGKLARVEGARVAGKTGTADRGEKANYASFVGGVLDAKHPFLALVALDSPIHEGTGPTAAAPVFARIARRMIAAE